MVSVPLRGCLFEKAELDQRIEEEIAVVSVPLRGCLFEILALQTLAASGQKMHFAAGMCFLPSCCFIFSAKQASALVPTGAAGISRLQYIISS